jgi:F420H(2)-dependent quinone reductase
MPRHALRRAFMKTMGASHHALYRASGGRIGGRLMGMPVLFLTTTGRKSGKRRVSPLLFIADGENVVVVGSNGGSAYVPAWWLNLSASPAAEIQIGRKRTKVVAREAVGEERARLWAEFTSHYSGYETYQGRTDRTIPVVVLAPL